MVVDIERRGHYARRRSDGFTDDDLQETEMAGLKRRGTGEGAIAD